MLGTLAGKVLVCHCRPGRACHADKIMEQYAARFGERASKMVYVGNGHSATRLQRTQWASPFKIGPHGEPDECLEKYAQWFEQPAQWTLRESLAELRGAALVCECPPGQPCHADFLAARLAASPWRPYVATSRRGKLMPQLVMAALVQGAVGAEIPRVPSQRWPQWSLDAAVRRCFPDHWLTGFRMPVLDDLANAFPFCAYPEFLEEQGVDADVSTAPAIVSAFSKGWRRAGQGNRRACSSPETAYRRWCP